LRGERKATQTIKSYTIGVRLFLAWRDREGIDPALDRPTVDKWIASLLDDGAEAANARSRQLAVRRYSAWLADEGEIPADQLAHMSPPKLDVKAVPVLDDDQLKAMIAACKGPRSVRARRSARPQQRRLRQGQASVTTARPVRPLRAPHDLTRDQPRRQAHHCYRISPHGTAHARSSPHRRRQRHDSYERYQQIALSDPPGHRSQVVFMFPVIATAPPQTCDVSAEKGSPLHR